MSNLWYLVLVIVIVAVLLYYSRYRTKTNERQNAVRDKSGPPRDYVEEREVNRVSRLSEEDRAWEAASLKKNQDTIDRNQPPTGSA